MEDTNKGCEHKFEDQDYYLVEDKWSDNLFTEIHNVVARKVHVCRICGGVFVVEKK